MTMPFNNNPPILFVTKATTPTTGATTMPATPQPPIPAAISDLITELCAAWPEWVKGAATQATPDQTMAPPDPDADAAVVKARRTGVGVIDARWAAMLRRFNTATQTDIRTTVLVKSLELARKTGMSATQAVEIAKGIACDKMPAPRVRSFDAAVAQVRAGQQRNANFAAGFDMASRHIAKQQRQGR